MRLRPGHERGSARARATPTRGSTTPFGPTTATARCWAPSSPAAITYFGFLSFFPLLALAFSVVGYISVVYPGAQDDVHHGAVEDAFPSLVGSGDGQINIQDIVDARAAPGSSRCSACCTPGWAGWTRCATACGGCSAPPT